MILTLRKAVKIYNMDSRSWKYPAQKIFRSIRNDFMRSVKNLQFLQLLPVHKLRFYQKLDGNTNI